MSSSSQAYAARARKGKNMQIVKNAKAHNDYNLMGLTEDKILMATPAPRPDAIEKVLTSLTGRSRTISIKTNTCSFCGGAANKFRNTLSRREYRISGFCQKCQDNVFGKD